MSILLGFKDTIRFIFFGYSIERHHEDGYEIHRGDNWGTVVVTDEQKYMAHHSRELNKFWPEIVKFMEKK